MRGIKLDSESPPYHSPEGSPEETFVRRQELAPEPTEPSMSTRGLGTVKISTKTAPTMSPSGIQHHPTSDSSEVYSGMNHLLHQVHSSRFGIPDEGQTNTRPQEQETQANAMFHQQQHQHQHQQEHKHTFANQSVHGQASAVWHLARPSREESPAIGTSMDVDEEMADAEGDASQGPFVSGVPSQGYVLSQHNRYPSPSQPQHHGGSGNEANLYHDINAQLRSAFLARLEMESRSRQ
ncbi:hypothetical protein BGZ82_006446 [Podila clonocystis]|nr:hypothetical protein BGZ82_006446 [Podila clonocystis]